MMTISAGKCTYVRCLSRLWLVKNTARFPDWFSKYRVQQNVKPQTDQFKSNLKDKNTQHWVFYNKPEVHASDIDRLDQKLFLLEKIRSYRGRQPVNENRANKKHYRHRNRKTPKNLNTTAHIPITTPVISEYINTNLNGYSFFWLSIKGWYLTETTAKKERDLALQTLQPD